MRYEDEFKEEGVKNLRKWILGSVIGSGFLLIASAFFVGMWAVLGRLGDEVGARAALGATGASAAGFLAAQILLITLLALAFLQKNMEGDALPERTPPG